MQETWKLSDGSLDFCGCQLSSQGGPRASAVWRASGPGLRTSQADDSEQEEGYWFPFSIQSNLDSTSFTLWVIPSTDPATRPGLLLAEQEENRGVSFTHYLPTTQRGEESLAFDTTVFRDLHPVRLYHRVVTVQYIQNTSFQTEAALYQWTEKCAQDFTGELAQTILEGVRHAKIGGLLRFLRRQPMGYCLVGGVSRAKDDSVSERVLSRLYDDSSTEGQASPQGEEPSDDSSQ